MTDNTSRRAFLKAMLGGAGVALLPARAMLQAAAAKAKPLNFVFFLVDDFGWMDIGANNPHCFYETPNIDRLQPDAVQHNDGQVSIACRCDQLVQRQALRPVQSGAAQ